MTNYDMSKPPGRTYKYYTGKPLFPFGFGLSLTAFELTCARSGAETVGAVAVSCSVKNTGNRTGDEVVMAYHRVGDVVRAAAAQKHPVPRRSLVQFVRVTVAAGATEAVHFRPFEEKSFALVDAAGDRTVYPGGHALVFSRGHGFEPAVNVTLPLPGRNH